MERQTALLLTAIFFVIFALITYYGACVKLWSSVAFSLFVSLILLNIFYPPGQVATDDADFTLFLYALFELVSIFILSVYIAQKTLSDTRY